MLALAGPLAVEKCRGQRVGCRESHDLVAQGHRDVGGFTGGPPHEIGEPRRALNEIVIGGKPAKRAAGVVARADAVDDVGPGAAHGVVAKAKAIHGPRAHVVKGDYKN